ncbi:hypothetical protein HF289_08910 [Acidithiobacillus ferrooxidans]|uniref:hypothetical protein n=1 Tax=Acidithiobacillus ferrooxidans TaxID=920 RepID=UPI001C0725D9|nr:hypothetical protein [Acidithiobacillus ferrooxidans]MBU2856989.1 hypothetical protein [Acidithiobacillus ferrooxidans]
MKAIAHFYPVESFEFVDKVTGQIKKLHKQPYDLDQGPGVRVLQTSVMRSAEALAVQPGDYEVEYYLELDRKGFLQVNLTRTRMVKPDQKPVAVNV